MIAPSPHPATGHVPAGAMAGQSPIMFFEPSHQGHVALHVTRLVEALAEGEIRHWAIFVISAALADRLDPETQNRLSNTPWIRATYLSPEETAPCITGGAIAMGRARWALAGAYANRYTARHVFFFLLDTVLIGAISRRPDDPIRSYSGILFRPRLHLPAMDTGRSLKQRIKTLRQLPYYALALAERRLSVMWTLDPFFPAYAKRWFPGGKKVQFLSEEAIAREPATAISRPREDRVRFLLYGVLKARKGILSVLDACLQLSPQDAARIELRLMGEHVTEDQAAIQDRLDALTIRCPNLRIVRTDRFLYEAELIDEITNADVILAPYIGHIGSSGVLYNAVFHGKALLTCREGLIGALVTQYRLGRAINPTVPTEVHEAMVALLDPGARKLQSPEARAYLELNAPVWTTTVLAGLPGTPVAATP